jgi:hypothetical protein
MALLFWDASALAKRYFGEIGSPTVNAVFASRGAHEMASTPWGYAETYSILLRRYNNGVLDRPTFTTVTTALQAEVVNAPDFGLLTITDAVVFGSIATMQAHHLNATDAAILTLLLEFSQSPDAPLCVLIASDQRLLRAAQAEGFPTLNPETLPAADVAAFLASLA